MKGRVLVGSMGRAGSQRGGSRRTVGRISHGCSGSRPPEARRDQERESLERGIAEGGERRERFKRGRRDPSEEGGF